MYYSVVSKNDAAAYMDQVSLFIPTSVSHVTWAKTFTRNSSKSAGSWTRHSCFGPPPRCVTERISGHCILFVIAELREGARVKATGAE